jgi:hypothetical protein
LCIEEAKNVWTAFLEMRAVRGHAAVGLKGDVSVAIGCNIIVAVDAMRRQNIHAGVVAVCKFF